MIDKHIDIGPAFQNSVVLVNKLKDDEYWSPTKTDLINFDYYDEIYCTHLAHCLYIASLSEIESSKKSRRIEEF